MANHSDKTVATVESKLLSLGGILGAETKVKVSSAAGGTVASAGLVLMYFLSNVGFVEGMPDPIKVALAAVISGILAWVASFASGFKAAHTHRPDIAPADTTA